MRPQQRDAPISCRTLASALQAGFGSYAQFHRVFRQYVGATPREHFRRPR
ncbi:MAG: AraC family transcriptional regulator [Planctomycetes bacterium]|nr:AraC family transcriptional regulator [Planctomycetota bacterium]